ncbi:MAG: HAD family phosphatase [Candidatus Cloacimonetes bacterium]|nr:HAD family phosphatase [Candidatus Cloacimonadota bacterium]
MIYKAVIFDLDGTLIDSMGVWHRVDGEFLAKRGITVPPDLFQNVEGGNSITEIAQYFKEKFDFQDSPESIIAEWTEMVRKHYMQDVKLKPGAKEFLEMLHRQNIKMGVGTSNSLELANIVLEANGVLSYFETIVAGCSNLRGKPFPDIFLRVASQLDTSPNNCIVMEDVLVGVQAAHAAEMQVWAIEDANSAWEASAIREEADFYASDYRQIQRYWEQIH